MIDPTWLTVPGLALLVLAGLGAFRWLGQLQKKVSELAERLSHLEGWRAGHDDDRDDGGS